LPVNEFEEQWIATPPRFEAMIAGAGVATPEAMISAFP